jgi:integrase
MLFLPNPKEQRPASIPLNARVRPVIERLAASGNEWLFQRPDGTRVSLYFVRDRLYEARNRAGILRKYWVHDLRRAFATWAYAHSGLLETQALLRHSTPVVTRRYVAVPEAALRETVDRMAADWALEQSENKSRESDLPSTTC